MPTTDIKTDRFKDDLQILETWQDTIHQLVGSICFGIGCIGWARDGTQAALARIGWAFALLLV